VFGLGVLIWAAPWPRRTRAALLAAAAALSVLIAYSRVYLGMHWPTDALGGLLLGTGWSALWVAWWDRRNGKVRPIHGGVPTS
jgi:undecaprenyl-diphosphatase